MMALAPPRPSVFGGLRYEENSLVPCRPSSGAGELCVAADLVARACFIPVLVYAFKALAVGGVVVGVASYAGTDDEEEIQPADHGGGGNPPAGSGDTGDGSGLPPGAPPPPPPPPLPPDGNGGGCV